MTLQISMLEETVQRLHIRLQRQIRALYVLHANGNEEAALIALDRISQINAKIAELNALLDSYDTAADGEPIEQDRDLTTLVPVLEEPVAAQQEVIIDDPDQDDVEMEYRGTLLVAVLAIVVIALGMLFGSKILNLGSDIADKAAPTVTVAPPAPTPPAVVPEPPTNVTVAAIDSVTYVVQKGDTLWSIATTQLGDGAAWGTVYGQNVDTIGDNPDLIFPGQVLTITKVSVGSESIG